MQIKNKKIYKALFTPGEAISRGSILKCGIKTEEYGVFIVICMLLWGKSVC